MEKYRNLVIDLLKGDHPLCIFLISGQLAQWLLTHQLWGVLWPATGKSTWKWWWSLILILLVTPPSAAVAGPPKGRSKEGEKVRSAPRVETNYPAELLLNRKAQPGYKVLPGPKTQSIPTFGDNQLQLRLPPKKREFEEEGGDTCDTPNILASGSKGPGPPDPPPPASPIALPTKKKALR